MQEGPSKRSIPAEIIVTCFGCEHYAHRMIKSGLMPLYADTCKHSTAPIENLFSMGNLKKQHNHPTPGDWCPFVPKVDTYYSIIEETFDEKGETLEYLSQYSRTTYSEAENKLKEDPKCTHIDYWDGQEWHNHVTKEMNDTTSDKI